MIFLVICSGLATVGFHANMANQSSHFDHELNETHIPWLLNILNTVATKSSLLGIQLGIPNSQICLIEHNCNKCDQLRAVIADRLKQEDPLTLHDIATALRTECIGENRLARSIESQSPPPLAGQKRTISYTQAQNSDMTAASTITLTSQASAEMLPPPTKVIRAETSQPLFSQLEQPCGSKSITDSIVRPSTDSALEVKPPSAKKHKKEKRSQPLKSPIQPYSSRPLTDNPVAQFIEFVKTTYTSSEVERVVKWPPTPSEVYINLACIDRKKVKISKDYEELTENMIKDGCVDAEKGPIEFSEIAKDISLSSERATSRRLILVEGAPGVGKSTFAWEFCRRWERGEIAQQYQLVLLLRLRDNIISEAKTLNDLIYHPLEGVPQAMCKELVLSRDLHAMIILEGYDELPDSCREEPSMFTRLISGKLLPLATILVTSRPWATQSIRKCHEGRIYQHIKVLGFTKPQIAKYLRSTDLKDEVSGLEAYMERHPQIRMSMYIPINSAIVVTVYK